MRVLFLVNVDTATSVPLEMARAVADRGVDVDVAAFYRQRRLPPGEMWPDVEILDAGGVADLGAWRRLARMIRLRSPRVLHLHHTASGVAGAVVGRGLRVPALVKTEHYDHRRASGLQTVANGMIMTLAHTVVANSRATKESFRSWERLAAGRRAVTIHNGVPTDRIESAARHRERVRERLGLGRPDLLVGSVGRLLPVKGHRLLLEAFARARSAGLEARLLIVGGGPEEQRLVERAEGLGVAGSVRITGWVSRERVHRLLGAMDLFVAPSRSEGFCNAAVEAMAAGVPVIATDLPALREVVGEAGRFVPPGSVAGLADALARAARLPEDERRAWGESGRRRARARFDLARTAADYVSLYRRLVEPAGA